MEIKLIDGEFDVAEAREILVKLIDFKINFHEAKIFSAHERNVSPGIHSLTRIKELKEARTKLIQMLNGLKEDDVLTIHSNVELLVESKILN